MLQKTCALVKDCDWVYVDKIERPRIIRKDLLRPHKSKEFEVSNFVRIVSQRVVLYVVTGKYRRERYKELNETINSEISRLKKKKRA